MGFTRVLAAGAILTLAAGLAPAAMAATAVPKLSGTYALGETEICQPGFSVVASTVGSTGASAVTTFGPDNGGAGDMSVTAGLITFTPKSKTLAWQGNMSFTATNYDGSLVNVTGSGSGVTGMYTAVTETPAGAPQTSTFSNNATSVTLTSDANHTYNAVYASIVSGVANHVDFVGTDSSGACVLRGTLTHQ